MKNLYLLLLVFTLTLSLNAQTIWDDFEGNRKGTYGFINGTFIPYNENPDQSGVNTSLVAAAYTRNPAELFDVIILDGAMADLSDYLSGAKSISIDVWAPTAGATVQITLENSTLAQPANFPVGRHSVYLATTSTSNAWETLTFSFDNQPDASVSNSNVDRIVLLFQPNTNSASQWYWDNLNGPELANDPCDGVMNDGEIFNDFECQQNVNFTFSHSGINFRRILNPDQNGNTSDYVARYVRNGGEENDVIIARTNGTQTLVDGATIDLDVWDPAAPTDVVISLQFNPGDGNDPTELASATATTSGSSAWETLNFDFSEAGSIEYNQMVILFDPGNFTSDEYFWDNLALGDIIESVSEAPAALQALDVLPNPAQDATSFAFELSERSDVQLRLLDLTGRVVTVIADQAFATGSHRIDYSTSQLQNGFYLYQLTIDGRSATGKLMIQK